MTIQLTRRGKNTEVFLPLCYDGILYVPTLFSKENPRAEAEAKTRGKEPEGQVPKVRETQGFQS